MENVLVLDNVGIGSVVVFKVEGNVGANSFFPKQSIRMG
jgi:hypothetical protein